MIDDDPDDQLFFRDALKEIGEPFICETANNGLEALKKLSEMVTPDLIFLDLNMPLMNGFECLRQLQSHEQYKNIPVIVYSTANDNATIENIKALGAKAFFRKPIDFKYLLEKLKTILSQFLPANNSFSGNVDFVI